MARYQGESLELIHPARTLLDEATFDHMNQCRAERGENQAQFVRQAITYFLLTKCSQKSTDSKIHPIGQTKQ